MFDSIGGMPLHPLVVHAVVVGAPLAALLGFLFAVPRLRAWARWPLAVVSVGAFAAAVVAKESGEGLQRTLGLEGGDNPVAALIARHSQLATQLLVVLAAYGVLALACAFLVGRRAGVVRAVDRVLPLALVVVGVLVLVWCYRVGDIGARAVWNPTGTQTY
ncbi:DUF2231 domain-containing protein [Microlunatus antarcticus]|uniref:Putative membrane protein n=1 Tax=Microlunatus antarcticus TaxID=53388 RepID=A0A7W5JVP4_9ACTN|nr:DUF2231 domain-containing protein [Microlunatus antarcticus]MBB3327148.1 putative membrane protein [Microlunatus antarcticus]